MSGRATGWHIKHFPISTPADRNRKLVLLSVADQCNVDGTYSRPGVAALMAAWKFDRATVHRHLAWLIENGWLEEIEKGVGRGNATSYSMPKMVAACNGEVSQPATPPAEKVSQPPAGSVAIPPAARTTPRKRATEEMQPSLDGCAQPAQPAKPIERRVAEKVFERKTPKPAGKHAFVSTMKIATALLAAGWHPQQIEDAMVAASTISIGAVEIELNRRRDQTSTRSVDDARDAPGGRIKL